MGGLGRDIAEATHEFLKAHADSKQKQLEGLVLAFETFGYGLFDKMERDFIRLGKEKGMSHQAEEELKMIFSELKENII